eukprot:g7635.t1
MPSNLFVVVFPRRVQAHTVFVDRKETKPRSKWSVGGLRSPPLLGRDGRAGKGDDKGNGLDQGSGRDNASCGSPASRGSSSRDASLRRGGHPGSSSSAAAAYSAARNELKNQKTVRVQLSRPTEDPVLEPGEDNIRPGSQLRRAESNGASWHPGSSASEALSRQDSAMGSAASSGRSLGGIGEDGREWKSDVLKEHKKNRSFILIPSGGGGGTSMADIFGESSERSSRASTSVGLTTSGIGIDIGIGIGIGNNNATGKKPARKGGGGREDRDTHTRNASAPSTSCLGLPNGGTGKRGPAAAEEPVGADRSGDGGIVVGNANAEKPERLGAPEDPPGGLPVNRAAKDGGDKPKKVEAWEEEDEIRRENGGDGDGGKRGVVPAVAASSLPDGGSSRPNGVHSVSVGAGGERRGGDASGDGQEGERKDAGEGDEDEEEEEDNDSEAAWNMQVTPKAARKAPPTAMSTPGSKRRLVTEVIGDGDDVDVSRPQDMDEGEKVDIEKLVRGILVEMRRDQLLIGEPTYHTSTSGKLMTCIFPCDVEDAHLVLTRLESVGVGSEIGSVNVLPMEIGRSDITRRRRENDEVDMDKARRARHTRATGGKFGDASSAGGTADGNGAEKDEDAARRANERFRALASQIRVTQVSEEIREGTKCHFDYMALLVASSAISAMGLATDNVAVVVAAMLVSPIMGPVLAFTFGTNVRDWSLAKKGFFVEAFSLLICVGVGFLVGMIGVFFITVDTWPTHEMETRGNPWGLITGVCIAIPSGMAVALSILSKNVNSLVGVAISASLLPPAVNTGLCLAVALIGPAVQEFHINAREYVMIGFISICLTILNILSIYVAGVSLFLFKEVAPIKSENSFWSQDMIYARKFQQKLGKNGGEGGEAAHMLRKTLLEGARRHKDGASGADSQGLLSGVDGHTERKASFSSNTNTHHRYRYKDKRRRPTVFDLFPEMNDSESGPSDAGDSGNTAASSTPKGGDPLKNAPAGARESLKLETGRVLGLLTNFLVRGDDHHRSSDAVANNAGSTRSVRTNEADEAS